MGSRRVSNGRRHLYRPGRIAAWCDAEAVAAVEARGTIDLPCRTVVDDAGQAARHLGFTVKVYRAASLSEISAARDAIRSDQMNGLLNFQGALSLANRQVIVDFATAHRVPAVYQASFFV